jgi:xylose isomerase
MTKSIVKGSREYFPNIKNIIYEGPESSNPLAFKFYNEDQIVAGKSMREHFRFSVAYWHTFCGTGGDPFGPGTKQFPWGESPDPMQASFDRLDAAFEFFTKLGIPFYCFHDRDIAPEGSSVAESERNLKRLVKAAKQKQDESGVELLWGTANLFSHPRYMNGAATNPDFNVVAHAAAQVKAALDATIFLGGKKLCILGWKGRLFLTPKHRYET